MDRFPIYVITLHMRQVAHRGLEENDKYNQMTDFNVTSMSVVRSGVLQLCTLITILRIDWAFDCNKLNIVLRIKHRTVSGMILVK